MKKPLDPRDQQVSEETRRLLCPDSDVAWECHSCHLIYSNKAAHVEFYPRCAPEGLKR